MGAAAAPLQAREMAGSRRHRRRQTPGHGHGQLLNSEISMKKILLTTLTLLFATAANADTIEMKVYGLVCSFCAQGIEKTLRKNPATADVVVSLEDKLVAVATREGQDISDADLTQALTDSGYDVKGITRTKRSIDDIRAQLKHMAK